MAIGDKKKTITMMMLSSWSHTYHTWWLVVRSCRCFSLILVSGLRDFLFKYYIDNTSIIDYISMFSVVHWFLLSHCHRHHCILPPFLPPTIIYHPQLSSCYLGYLNCALPENCRITVQLNWLWCCWMIWWWWWWGFPSLVCVCVCVQSL